MLEQRPLLARMVADVDRFCDIAAELRGAPSTESFTMINKRVSKDIGQALAYSSTARRGLEALARYRVEVNALTTVFGDIFSE